VAVPEGDTVAKLAKRLHSVLAGKHVETVGGTNPRVRAESDRLTASVVGVRSYGKHLIIDFSTGRSVRTHLGMPGMWHIYNAGQPWRRPQGAARVVLRTAHDEAVCFSAPQVEVERTKMIDAGLARWGPDLAQRRSPWMPSSSAPLTPPTARWPSYSSTSASWQESATSTAVLCCSSRVCIQKPQRLSSTVPCSCASPTEVTA
jgi:hypothetical protein